MKRVSSFHVNQDETLQDHGLFDADRKLPAKKRFAKLSGFRKIALKNYQWYLLLLPGLAATFIFSYLPIYGVQIAFRDFRVSLGFWGSEWVGLKHFIRFITYPAFGQIVRNTLSITLYSLATFPLPLCAALLMNELRSVALKKTVQMVSYAPHFLSTVVVCGMIKLFLDRENGIVNSLVVLLGGERASFLSLPEMFNDIYVWSGVWQNIGWYTIIYLAALSGVSQELVEAARIDGANRLHIIRHINIPTILPTVIILFILSTGTVLSLGFEKIFLLQNDLNLGRSTVISTYVYQVGLVSGQYSYSTAINLFNNIVNVIVLVSINKVARSISEVSLW
ncbi:MAG: sugar ABC transporter permease [Ruminococcaceae bacterium]|nr:sugar ABC transporter permease [Oscillospiraceae bacterium]